MIVMQVADDDVLDRIGGDAERQQSFAHRLDHLALTFLTHGFVKAGIDDDGAGRPNDRPNKEIERLQHVVRIPRDEVRRLLTLMMTVAHRIDFVQVVAHRTPSPVFFLRSSASSALYHRGAATVARKTMNPGAGPGFKFDRCDMLAAVGRWPDLQLPVFR